ncbi:MAG: xanthine dehydrogenase family protein subunit M [Actinomycetota bacterium]
MKPPPFDYAAATSVDHAVSLLNGGRDARVIAGGQSLMPLLNLRLAGPELVVDIGRIPDLGTVTIDPTDGALVIGANVTQAEVAAHPDVAAGWPVLVDAIRLIGHAQIRNRGTICGSLAHNDPLAELPAVAVAFNADVAVISPAGQRTVAATDLFAGPFMTTLAGGDLIVAVRFPAPRAGSTGAIREFATRTGDYATAGVVCRLDLADGAVSGARVVVFGLGSGPIRMNGVEAALVGATAPTIDDGVLAASIAALEPPDDVHASAATRTELAAVLITEAVAEAWERGQ